MKNRIAMAVIQQAIFTFSWSVRVNKILFQFDSYGSWSQVAMWLLKSCGLTVRHISLRNLFSLLRNLDAQLNLPISKIFSSSNCQSSNVILFHPKESSLHALTYSGKSIDKQIHDGSIFCAQKGNIVSSSYSYFKNCSNCSKQGKKLPKRFMSSKKYLIPWEIKKLAC